MPNSDSEFQVSVFHNFQVSLVLAVSNRYTQFATFELIKIQSSISNQTKFTPSLPSSIQKSIFALNSCYLSFLNSFMFKPFGNEFNDLFITEIIF
jgi:hypothetical protein